MEAPIQVNRLDIRVNTLKIAELPLMMAMTMARKNYWRQLGVSDTKELEILLSTLLKGEKTHWICNLLAESMNKSFS